jgi:polysaccharide pyruvyl transferase WcaK-like protein
VTRRSIAFFGLFGVTNLGNEASLRAGIQVVRRLDPDAELSCICHYPEAVEREHGIAAYSFHMAGRLDRWHDGPRWRWMLARPLVEVNRWVAAFRFLRTVDLVIIPGTGILDDFGVRPWQMPYILYRWSLLTRLTRTRLAYVAVGAGPIRERANRWLMRAAVGQADECSYRDEGSRDFMASIGRDTARDRVVPDIAFALIPPDDGVERDRPTTVGLGVMAYYGWENSSTRGAEVYRRYVDTVAEVGRRLLDAGHSIRLLVGEGTDQEAVDDLTPVLTAGASGDRAHVETGHIDTMDELFHEIGRTDVVVATRYHNVVAALIMGRPVVSAGYAEKNRWLLADVGLDSHCQSVDAIDPERIVASVADLLARRDEHVERIRKQTASWRGEVEAEVARVIESATSRGTR